MSERRLNATDTVMARNLVHELERAGEQGSWLTLLKHGQVTENAFFRAAEIRDRGGPASNTAERLISIIHRARRQDDRPSLLERSTGLHRDHLPLIRR